MAVVRLLGALTSRAVLSCAETGGDRPGPVSSLGADGEQDPAGASGPVGGGVCASVESAAGARAHRVDAVAVRAAGPGGRAGLGPPLGRKETTRETPTS